MYAQYIGLTTPDSILCKGSSATFYAISYIGTPHFIWYVNRVPDWRDKPTLTIDTPVTGDSVFCVLLNSFLEVVDTSRTIGLAVDTVMPDAGTLTFVGSDTICVGSTTSLTASVPGGVWYSSGQHASVTSGLITAIAGGISECGRAYAREPVLYILSGPGCADTASAAVVVNDKPYAGFTLGMGYDSRDYVCLNTWVPINNGNGPCGAMFTANGCVAVSGDGLQGMRPGYDTVYSVVTNACGTTTYSKGVSVPVRPQPPQNVPVIKVCEHDTVSVAKADYPGSWEQGSWNPAYNVTSLTYAGSRLLFTGIRAGNGILLLYNENVCGREQVTVTTTVFPTPARIVVPEPVLCKDSSVRLYDTTASGTWTIANSAIATIDATGLLTAADTGHVIVLYTSTDGCTIATSIAINNCSAPSHAYAIYPNPATDQLIIEQDIAAYYDHYYITNMTGAKIDDGPVTGIFKIVDVSGLARGVYFLRISGQHGIQLSRFVKL